MLAPRIYFLDIDTFFVSVERLLDPSLRGKPVVVGGRAAAAACDVSELRGTRVRRAVGMSIREASERAPADTVFVPGHHEVYSDYSTRATRDRRALQPGRDRREHRRALPRLPRLRAHVPSSADADDDATILRVARDDRGDRSRARAAGKRGHRDQQADGEGGQRARQAAGVLRCAPARRRTRSRRSACASCRASGRLQKRSSTRSASTRSVSWSRHRGARSTIFGAYTSGILRSARGGGNDELGRERPASRARSARQRRRDDLERAHVRRGQPQHGREVLSGLSDVASRARHRGVLPASHAQVALHRLRDHHAWADHRAVERQLRDPPRRAHVVWRSAHARAADPAVGVRSRSCGSMPCSCRCSTPASGAGCSRPRRDRFGYDAVHLATTISRHRRAKRSDR